MNNSQIISEKSSTFPVFPIQEGLNFILNHFQEPIWPRTISTLATNGAQITVYNKEEALEKFRQSNMDCRISAYPLYIEYDGINRQAPNFLFAADLDWSNFKSSHILRLALGTTNRHIKKTLGAVPTILWSGNGYHVYLPINSFILEQEEVFSRFAQPSRKFLQFAEQYLSNDKSDSAHNTTVSLRNCMVKIPGSRNSKYLDQGKESEVKIIQKWDGNRAKINLLLGSFYAYLVNQRLNDWEGRKKGKNAYSLYVNRSFNFPWIEKLLRTPIHDSRKFAIWRIITPYLRNVKKLSDKDSVDAIKQWLLKCNELRKLDFNADQKTKEGLRGAARGYLPISLSKLKEERPYLYNDIRFLL